MHARSRTALPLALVAGLLAFAQPARAQDAAVAPATQSAPSLTPAPVATAPVDATAPAVAAPATTGPTVDASAVGVRHQADVDAPAAARHGNGGPGTALMIVGGAAILVGIVVGGNAGYAISLGGAVVGLYGLYQYLN